MSEMTVRHCKLKGAVSIPPSKSVAHRAIIASSLAGGGKISNLELSEDIKATQRCIATLFSDDTPLLDCGESGSTLRFMIPIALATGKQVSFTGIPYLLSRPLTPYERLFNIKRTQNGLMTEVSIKPGVFELEGNVSSQFVTGLLFALPLLDGNSSIVMTTELESKPYVDLTLMVLEAFGITVDNDNYRRFEVKGGQRYKPRDFTVEGDYSQAAFWLTANELGAEIECSGLNPHSLQGDRAICDIIANDTRVIDVRDIPDLVPILAVLCSFRKGKSEIINAARLRLKECDRLNAVTKELNSLGADITELENGLIINGVETLHGGHIDSHNDHRIAMAAAIAATRSDGDVVIHGADCVKKSYPAFWEHFQALRGNI